MLRRDVVNVLDKQVPMPELPVGVVGNDMQIEPPPDIVDHTAYWDDANATDDDAMYPDDIVSSSVALASFQSAV